MASTLSRMGTFVVALYATAAFAAPVFALGEEVKEKRLANAGFLGGISRGPKWPLVAPPMDTKDWYDYGANYPGSRSFHHSSEGGDGGDIWIPRQRQQPFDAWENQYAKRSPGCMSRCVNQGQIHPIMCHSLC